MPVCGNYLFFELPKKIVLNPKDGCPKYHRQNQVIYTFTACVDAPQKPFQKN